MGYTETVGNGLAAKTAYFLGSVGFLGSYRGGALAATQRDGTAEVRAAAALERIRVKE